MTDALERVWVRVDFDEVASAITPKVNKNKSLVLASGGFAITPGRGD